MRPLRNALLLLAVPFSAFSANLVVNPNFDSDASGWTFGGGNGSSFAYWEDATGYPTAGSLGLVAGLVGDSPDARQCINISSQAVDLAAYARIDYTGGDQNFGEVGISSFSTSDCSGGYIAYARAGMRLATDGWVMHRLVDYALPATTQSVMIFLKLPVDSTSIGVFMDQVAFGPTGSAGLPPLPPNLLDNPDFDSSLFGWSQSAGSGSAYVAWDGDDGNPTPGSVALVANLTGDQSHVYQCVDIDDSNPIDLFAYSKATYGEIGTVALSTFGSAGCIGYIDYRTVPTVAAGDGWHLHYLLGHALPSGTRSVIVWLRAQVGTGSIAVNMDHAAFGVSGTVGAPALHAIGGSVSGLVGSGLVLQLNGGELLSIADDGAFSFTAPVLDGGTYEVTVATQPSAPEQTCTVANGVGTATGDVGDVQVNCAAPSGPVTVSATVDGGHGSVSPTTQVITYGLQASITLSPDDGYQVQGVGGDCPSGTLSFPTYATGAVTTDCAITVSFEPLPSDVVFEDGFEDAL